MLLNVSLFSSIKVEDSDVSKSSGSLRSKKPVTKMVMEYCYEPEMEEVLPAISSKKLKVFMHISWRGFSYSGFTFIYIYRERVSCLAKVAVVVLYFCLVLYRTRTAMSSQCPPVFILDCLVSTGI